jgi:uncharacterized protein YbjT (DUF2867 family)
MRLLIVGASGGVGRLLTKMAWEADHVVTATQRDVQKCEHPPGIRLVAADGRDPAPWPELCRGQDAILSCVGLMRRDPRNPWSRLTTSPDTTTRTITHLIEGAHAAGVRRLIMVSACGVGDSAHQMPLVFRALLRVSAIGTAYADLERAEALLASSGLDWYAVRPAALFDGPETHDVKTFPLNQHVGARWISRADVARYLLQLAAASTPGSPRTPSIAR